MSFLTFLAWLIAVLMLLYSLTGCSGHQGLRYHARCLEDSDTICGMVSDRKNAGVLPEFRKRRIGDTLVLDGRHYVIYSVDDLNIVP